MTDLAGFGPSLRRERERRGIPLQAIADRTKISVSLLADLEQTDFSRWPSGIFRRAFLRAYAGAVGLDPEQIVAEAGRLFPEDGSAPPARPVLKAQPPQPEPPPADGGTPVGFRIMFEDAETAPGAMGVRSVRTLRVMAALGDAAILLAGGGLGTLVGGVAGLWPGVALAAAIALVGATLVSGRTPGGWLFLTRPPARSQLTTPRAAKRWPPEKQPGAGVRRHAARRVEHRRPY
jgi:transcriptional regulator with XRE-family HTH domain